MGRKESEKMEPKREERKSEILERDRQKKSSWKATTRWECTHTLFYGRAKESEQANELESERKKKLIAIAHYKQQNRLCVCVLFCLTQTLAWLRCKLFMSARQIRACVFMRDGYMHRCDGRRWTKTKQNEASEQEYTVSTRGKKVSPCTVHNGLVGTDYAVSSLLFHWCGYFPSLLLLLYRSLGVFFLSCGASVDNGLFKCFTLQWFLSGVCIHTHTHTIMYM